MSNGGTSEPCSADDLVLAHRHLIGEVSRRYRNKGVHPEDVEQVAAVGLVLAARRFDSGRSIPFPAFAVPTMHGEVRRYFRDSGWAVRPPRSVQELAAAIRSQRARLEQELGREPGVDDLARATGADEPAVRRALQALGSYSIVSFDASAPGDGTWALADHDQKLLDERSLDMAEDVVARLDLHRAIGRLSGRDQQILRLRYVDELSQVQVARRMSLSQVHVSRLLRRIHAALHAMLVDGPGAHAS